jgi:hypothetical protein
MDDARERRREWREAVREGRFGVGTQMPGRPPITGRSVRALSARPRRHRDLPTPHVRRTRVRAVPVPVPAGLDCLVVDGCSAAHRDVDGRLLKQAVERLGLGFVERAKHLVLGR